MITIRYIILETNGILDVSECQLRGFMLPTKVISRIYKIWSSNVLRDARIRNPQAKF